MDYETHNPRKYLRCLRKLVLEWLGSFKKKGSSIPLAFYLEGMTIARKYCCVVCSWLDCMSKQGWYKRMTMICWQIVTVTCQHFINGNKWTKHYFVHSFWWKQCSFEYVFFQTKIGVRSISLLQNISFPTWSHLGWDPTLKLSTIFFFLGWGKGRNAFHEEPNLTKFQVL